MSDLDRLYTDLATASGVLRIRDIRLETLAMDRALEARFEVGTTADGNDGIPHPTAQPIARTYPHRGHTPHSVHENAVWSFETSWQADFVPRVVDAWMNSLAHRANLERLSDTHWGLGYHIENPAPGQTNKRFYVIAVFSEVLVDIPPKHVTLAAGNRTGRKFTAIGKVIEQKTVGIPTTVQSPFDAVQFFPSQGRLHYHLTDGPLKGFWVKAGVSE